MEHERDFGAKADTILAYLKSKSGRYDPQFLPRPFFVEVTGPPSSGKTKLVAELDGFLRELGLRVFTPQEGARAIRHLPRTTPLYNIRTGLYALTQLIDLAQGHTYDLVIFERCLFDAYAWMMYWQEKKALTAEKARLIQEFFLSPFFTQYIDVAYFVTCAPEVAFEREIRGGFSLKRRGTTNLETMRVLTERFLNAHMSLSPRYPQIHLVDTSHLDPRKMVEVVSHDLLKILEAEVKRDAAPTGEVF